MLLSAVHFPFRCPSCYQICVAVTWRTDNRTITAISSSTLTFFFFFCQMNEVRVQGGGSQRVCDHNCANANNLKCCVSIHNTSFPSFWRMHRYDPSWPRKAGSFRGCRPWIHSKCVVPAPSLTILECRNGNSLGGYLLFTQYYIKIYKYPGYCKTPSRQNHTAIRPDFLPAQRHTFFKKIRSLCLFFIHSVFSAPPPPLPRQHPVFSASQASFHQPVGLSRVISHHHQDP